MRIKSVDRWHLMANSSRAFMDAVGKSIRQIRQAVGSNIIDPELLTYAERLQHEGYLRRQATNEAIQTLAKKGTSIRQIVRQTGHSGLARTPSVRVIARLMTWKAQMYGRAKLDLLLARRIGAT